MRILVTNDDGYRSAGIELMADVAAKFGEVTVVAPDTDCSGISQAITLSRPLRLVPLPGEGRYVVIGGTPADCTYLGIHHLMGSSPPDLVLSGVNPGPNLSWDVLYSGTTGAARVAVLQGFPAMAVSLMPAPGGYPFHAISEWVERCVERALSTPPFPRVYFNVNIPNPLQGPIRGIRAAKLGERSYSREIDVRHDPRGKEYLWIGGREVLMGNTPGSDCAAVNDRYVSVTPVGCDPTAWEAMPQITASWDWTRDEEEVA